MGKRGPSSSHPSGFGHTTKSGYHRAWCAAEGRAKFVHVMVWEERHGPKPGQSDIHHVNGDKQDNRIENLECVSRTTHKRIHGGCELESGVWRKPCSDCHKVKPIDSENWYLRGGRPYLSRCKVCHIKDVKRHRDRRVARARILGAIGSPEAAAEANASAPAGAQLGLL